MEKIASGKVWDRLWNRIRNYEDHIASDPWSQIHLPVMNALGSDRAGSRFLDAGCGPGQWCFYMSKKFGCESAGYDIAEETIYNLNCYVQENKINNVVFKKLDLNAQQSFSDTFDFITSFGVIEHFHDSQPMLNNLHKLLSDDGILFLSVPNLYSFHTILRPLAKIFGVWEIGYEKSFSPAALKREVEKSGFRVLETRILPSFDLFGSFLSNRMPFLRNLSFWIESRNSTFGFVVAVILKKKSADGC